MTNPTKFPKGWDERRVLGVVAHYEGQTEDEAVAEDEAAFVDSDPKNTMMGVPRNLVSKVRALIASEQDEAKSAR
ncbi:MAG: hypothetical protein HY791_31910 [Deltaproteobacteria bacterium]|nr:hypothetical protein [Deltaproteobacteria bacterium]